MFAFIELQPIAALLHTVRILIRRVQHNQHILLIQPINQYFPVMEVRQFYWLIQFMCVRQCFDMIGGRQSRSAPSSLTLERIMLYQVEPHCLFHIRGLHFLAYLTAFILLGVTFIFCVIIAVVKVLTYHHKCVPVQLRDNLQLPDKLLKRFFAFHHAMVVISRWRRLICLYGPELLPFACQQAQHSRAGKALHEAGTAQSICGIVKNELIFLQPLPLAPIVIDCFDSVDLKFPAVLPLYDWSRLRYAQQHRYAVCVPVPCCPPQTARHFVECL